MYKILKNLDQKTCEYCEESFLPKHVSQKFCDKICKSKYRSKKDRLIRKKRENKNCLKCNTSFVPVKSTQKFCTYKCGSSYWYNNNKKYACESVRKGDLKVMLIRFKPSLLNRNYYYIREGSQELSSLSSVA